MGAGAPAELVVAAQRALGDEIEHARGAFALASAYAGTALGPGPLAAEGVLADSGLAASVSAAIHEACVGETLAAIEAREALSAAGDPAVRALLEKIVADESAHAELGWRFLHWSLRTAGPELRARARQELGRAIRLALAQTEDLLATAEPAGADETAADLERHGLCRSARRAAARRGALLEIVQPLADALLGDLGGDWGARVLAGADHAPAA